MTSTYAGCGCTALTPAYGRPTFVPALPRGYGAEDDKGMTDTQRTVGLVVTGLALAAMVTVFINITPPQSRKPIPTSTLPRSRPSRW